MKSLILHCHRKSSSQAAIFNSSQICGLDSATPQRGANMFRTFVSANSRRSVLPVLEIYRLTADVQLCIVEFLLMSSFTCIFIVESQMELIILGGH